MNELNKPSTWSKGSGIALTNNETKYIINVITSLGNRGILVKETTSKKN